MNSPQVARLVSNAAETATDRHDQAISTAEQTLARLNMQVEATRGELIRLLHDVAEAQRRLDQSQAVRLVEANERLVLVALRNQADTEAAVRALDVATHLAERDVLTQLPNRVLMLARFAQAITLARRHGARMAVIFLDIDRFKQINDTLGHAVGDQVLQWVAHGLVASVREADTVCRLGGDKFVVLLTEIVQASDVAAVAAKVIAALGAPCRVGDHVLDLSASIGISVFPDDGDDSDTLLEKADAAMYRAKRQGPGGCAYHGAASADTR